MRVVAYLRVSTDRQAEEGLGLDIQRSAITSWARAKGHRVVAEFADEGVSGSNGLETREGLLPAYQALRNGLADALVVYRLDRLARDLILQETLLREIREMDRDVFSTFDSESAYLRDDPEDPSRRMIRQVLGAVGEYERGMISMRLRAGRRLKSRQGGYAYGSPPFGLRAENKALMPDDNEQAALTRAAELRRSGHSLREIAEVLEREGHRAKRGGRWHPTTLNRALARAEELK
jgi:DNA invertase Pin-like site-specific DNA recombinase